MEELFELIKAFNRLKEKIVELICKIDLLIKSPADGRDAINRVSGSDATHRVSGSDAINRVSTADGYVEEEGACRILHICPRTLAKLRAEASIPYIKKGKKIHYLIGDLHSYLEQIKTK